MTNSSRYAKNAHRALAMLADPVWTTPVRHLERQTSGLRFPDLVAFQNWIQQDVGSEWGLEFLGIDFNGPLEVRAGLATGSATVSGKNFVLRGGRFLRRDRRRPVNQPGA